MSIDNQDVSEITKMIEISRRTSFMIYYVLLIIIILSISVVYLTWSQKNDMRKLNGYMEGMTKDISVMSNAIVKMQASMTTMEGGISKVVTHTQNISGLITQKENPLKTLSHIANTLKLMQSDSTNIGGSMENVNYNLNTINKQMKSLNRKLGTMVQDVNRMPSPTRMFPF
ncbi:MAG: hypothetical protein KZQ83_18050 [gamma proteobacterium symbiont of Taylorina sp.]|nr:hypothetical protein [gamma proteobacterium symbiont of Taylorina sp.]